MKKILSLLMFIVLVFGLIGGTFAYDGEITFQDIPWGSSNKEVKKLLTKKFGKKHVHFENIGYYANDVTPAVDKDHMYNEIGGFTTELRNVATWHMTCSLKSVKIAGYEAKEVYLWFFMPNGKGKKMNGKEALHGASVELMAVNIEEARADLVEKLTQVYGKPLDGNPMDHIWVGQNNTIVSMSDINSEHLFIAYTQYPDSDDKIYLKPLPELVDPTSVPSNNVDSSDTSGL